MRRMVEHLDGRHVGVDFADRRRFRLCFVVSHDADRESPFGNIRGSHRIVQKATNWLSFVTRSIIPIHSRAVRQDEFPPESSFRMAKFGGMA